MGVSVFTLAHDSTPIRSHESIGERWCTIADSVCALLASRIEEGEGDYSQLRRIGSGKAVDFVGQHDLEELITETERIPGSEPDLRFAMGKLHGAAATAFFADLVVACRPTTAADLK